MRTQSFNLASEELLQVIRQELKNYHLYDEEPHPSIMSFRAIKSQLETQSQPNALFAKRLALNTVLHQTLDETHKESKDSATLLRKRFLEKETIPAVSEFFHISQATVSRWTDRAVDIATAKFIQIEEEANESWYNRLTAHLPSQRYDRMVGVDGLRDRLVTRLVDPKGPGVIALSGIGGIGKSSMADFVIRKALRSGNFQQVAWVEFRPEQIELFLTNNDVKDCFVSLLADAVVPNTKSHPIEKRKERLTDRLKSEAYLIVIDNLEDQHETDAIIQCLHGVVHPSRFIVTTRAQPARTTCHVASLTELTRNDSLSMMQYYLESTGQTQIGKVDEETLDKIFRIVGGNPLALKITAGLMQWMPLDNILTDLEKGRGDASLIYQTIFWHTWETLSADSQLLLQAMALSGAVVDVSSQTMQEASGLADQQFWQAVNELLLRSMLEVRGSLDNRRYGMHRLTETFIKTEITNRGYD